MTRLLGSSHALIVFSLVGGAASCSFGYEEVDADTTGLVEAEGGANSGGFLGDNPTSTSGGASPIATTGGSPPMMGLGGEDSLGSMGGADPGPPPVAYCDEIPFLLAPPVLDGELDAGGSLELVSPRGWRGIDPLPDIPDDVQMQFSVGWRPNGLYFFVRITDPDLYPAEATDEPWMGDTVEIFVDHDAVFETAPPYFDDQGTRQFFVSSPEAGAANSVRAERRFPIGDYTVWDQNWIGVRTDEGFAIEVFIAAEELELDAWTLSAGQQVAIDLAHDVSLQTGESDADGRRMGQYFLSLLEPLGGTDNDYPFNNEAAFCVTTLIDD